MTGRGTRGSRNGDRSLAVARRLHGDNSIQVAQRYASLGYFYARLGRADEALGWFDPAASLHRSLLGDEHAATKGVVEYHATLMLQQAELALKRKDRQLAKHLLHAAYDMAAPVLGFTHETTRRVRDARDSIR